MENMEYNIQADIALIGDIVINQLPEQQDARDDDEIRRDLQALLRNNRQQALQVNVPHVRRDNVPVRNPTMNQILFYTGESPPASDEYNPRSRINLSTLAPLAPHELFNEVAGETPRFVAVLGDAGAGKSTISRRLCDATDKITLHANFMNMDYTSDVTIADVLLRNRYQCGEEDTQVYFNWMQRHQAECRIILDGYDQASWQNTTSPEYTNPNDPKPIDVTIGNLFRRGGILQNTDLLVTSRPYAMLHLPDDLQPQRVLMLAGFSPDDARELFIHFVGEEGEERWRRLQSNAPQLSFMSSNPAMLVYISAACCTPLSGDEPGGRDITTITSVLQIVLRGIQHAHGRTGVPVEELMPKVELIAFNATRAGTVLITRQNLRDVGLDVDDVQDLTIVLPAAFAGICALLFDGDVKLYFNHQTLQEFFSAKYAVSHQMALSTFKQFVENDLFDFHWTMVRRFAAALLINDDFNRGSEAVHRTLHPTFMRQTSIRRVLDTFHINPMSDDFEKRRCFLQELLKTFAQAAKTLNEGSTQDRKKSRQLFLDLLLDVRECNHIEVTRAIAKRFPKQVILEQMPFTASEAHAFAFVFRHVTKDVDYLDLRYCNLTTQQFDLICTGILDSQVKVNDVNFHNNSLDTGGAVVVARVLPKIGKFFRMGDAFLEEHGRRNVTDDERKIIQRALDANQDPNLAVCVGGLRDVMKARIN